MSVTRPALADLLTRAQVAIESRLPGGGVFREKGVLKALAIAKAYMSNGEYAYLSSVSLNATALYCDEPTLVAKAAEFGMTYLPATPASGNVTITGIPTKGIDTTAIFQSDAGIQYQVTSDVTLTGTTATVPVTATTGGADTNLDVGASLQLISPVTGIQAAAVVATGGLAGGADEETEDQLRARLLQRMQYVPAGGNAGDFEQWVRDAYPDVANVWVSGEAGPGVATVYFTITEAAGGPIPPDQVVDTVNAYVQAKLPVTGIANVVAPVAVPQNFSIGLTPDTPDTEEAVTDALTALIQNEGSPGGTILLTHIRTSIGTAAGVTDYTCTLVANLSYSAGQLPVMGVITWL